MERKGFIGGSDISAVLGMNRWKTPMQLWMEKTGVTEPKDLSGVEAVQLGSELEEFVAKKFERETGMKVRRPPVQHYTHPKYPWAKAQIDRLIEGTDELLEVKTASAYKVKEWSDDEIPEEYILQVYWQLLITGRKVGWIAVLIGGQKFLYKRIEADPKFQQELLDKAVMFWNMVQDNERPSAMYGDDDALLALHPTSDDAMQNLQEFETAVARRQEIRMQISDLEYEQKEIEVKIKEAIGDNLGFLTEKYKVVWRPMRKMSVDTQAIKDAGLFEQYSKVSEYRQLDIRLNKKKEG